MRALQQTTEASARCPVTKITATNSSQATLLTRRVLQTIEVSMRYGGEEGEGLTIVGRDWDMKRGIRSAWPGRTRAEHESVRRKLENVLGEDGADSTPKKRWSCWWEGKGQRSELVDTAWCLSV